MAVSHRHLLLRSLSIATTCGLVLTLIASLLIVLFFVFSFLISDEPLLVSFNQTPVNSVHFVLDGGQLQIGTQTEVPSISDWVKGVRSGMAWFGAPVVDTFDFNVGAVQLSWITFNGQPPTFGFACPLLAALIPAALAGWCLNAVRRVTERRLAIFEQADDRKPAHPA